MRMTSQKGFSGIDERVEMQNGVSAAAFMKNLRVTDGGSLRKRPDIEITYEFPEGDINGLWCGNFNGRDSVFAAVKGKLYRFVPHVIPSPEPELIAEIPEGDCEIFEFNGALYFKSADFYAKYDENGFANVEGYIPCVAISCSPSGEGTAYEQINLICDKRRQLFSGDGKTVLYALAEKDIDEIISVKVDGEDYTYRYGLFEGCKISFEMPPAEGLNNVEVIYSKANNESDRRRIMGCTRMMFFGGNSDGRAFLWGNPEYPNYRFHSDLADGVPSVEYFPVNAFTVIGNSKINCIVQQYDRQLIFTKNEAFYSYCELRDDGLGNLISSFPVYSLNGSKGCIFETDGCIIDNRPVTLCEDGLNMWEATSVENEKNAICFSGPIGNTMRRIVGEEKSDTRLFDFQAARELYFLHDEQAYIYNYGNGAWYVYTGFNGKLFKSIGNTLYFATGSKLMAFSNTAEAGKNELGVWESGYITTGQSRGRTDVIGVDADIYVSGEVNLIFDIESGEGRYLRREFNFKENAGKYIRISFRPALRRIMPFRISIEGSGDGNYTIHGMSIITREKERSKRDGLL